MGAIARFVGYTVIVIVALAVVASIFHSQDQSKSSNAKFIAQPSASQRDSAAATEPAPESRPNPITNAPSSAVSAPPAVPALSEDEIKGLISQRQYDADLISTTQRLLSTSAFMDRAWIYCAFASRQAQVMLHPEEQPTVDLGYIQQCQSRIFWRTEQMPTDEQFHEKAAKAQQEIQDIDAKLKATNIGIDSHQQ